MEGISSTTKWTINVFLSIAVKGVSNNLAFLLLLEDIYQAVLLRTSINLKSDRIDR